MTTASSSGCTPLFLNEVPRVVGRPRIALELVLKGGTDELKRKDELELIGGSAYLTELTNYVPTAAHAAAYAEMVAQTAVRRRLIKASSGITELGYDESTTTQELLEKAEAELFSVSDQSTKQDLVSLESILTDSFDRIEELSKKDRKSVV